APLRAKSEDGFITELVGSVAAQFEDAWRRVSGDGWTGWVGTEEDGTVIERASCKIHRTRRIFPVFAGRSGRRSGRRGPELRDAEYLIDRERHNAEHEVAFDLDRAAHAHGPCAEFILQSGVDAFGQ